MKNKIEKIIISGSTGYIGTKLVNFFLSKGFIVYALVRDKPKALKLFKKNKNLKIIICTNDNLKNLDKIILENSFKSFIHLSWENAYGDKRDDLESQFNNIKNMLDVIKLCNKMGIKKFIGIGTFAEIYSYKMLEENRSLDNNSLYSISKYSAYNISKIICNKEKIDFIWVRLSNVFGIDDNPKKMLSVLIEKIISNQTMKLSACNQIYDFIWVDDAIKYLFLISEKGINNRTYILGSGKPKFLSTYIHSVLKIFGKGKIEFDLNRIEYTINKSDLSTRELVNDTGYIPLISFQEGIKIIKKHITNAEESNE